MGMRRDWGGRANSDGVRGLGCSPGSMALSCSRLGALGWTSSSPSCLERRVSEAIGSSVAGFVMGIATGSTCFSRASVLAQSLPMPRQTHPRRPCPPLLHGLAPSTRSIRQDSGEPTPDLRQLEAWYTSTCNPSSSWRLFNPSKSLFLRFLGFSLFFPNLTTSHSPSHHITALTTTPARLLRPPRQRLPPTIPQTPPGRQRARQRARRHR